MVAPNYPNNPSIGDETIVNGKTFRWDGEKWKGVAPLPVPIPNIVVRETVDRVFNIPTDYSSIQECIDDTYNRLTPSPDAEIIINIESGHALTSGVSLTKGGDYSHYRITSDDAVVYLDSGFVPVDSSDVSESNRAIFFYQKCRTPILDCLIDAEALNGYDFDGLVANQNAIVGVLSDAGIRNARYNLLVRAAQCYAKGTDWYGAGRNTARFTENSRFVISESILGGGWQLKAEGRASDGSLHISRSSIGQAQQCVINDNGYSGITVRRSWVYLFGTEIGIVGKNGGASTNIAIRPFDGATIIANGVTFNGNPITPFSANVPAFNITTPDGIVYEPNAPSVIEDIDSDDSTERTINVYGNTRITQIKLNNFSLNDPDVTVNLSGFSSDHFMSATITPVGSNAWMAGTGFTNRLAAVNALVVSTTNSQARIRQADAGNTAVDETLDMVLTITGHPS